MAAKHVQMSSLKSLQNMKARELQKSILFLSGENTHFFHTAGSMSDSLCSLSKL
jgi:hypothetical protein